MPAESMQERLRKISCFVNVKPMPGYLTLITPDLQEDPLPDLSTKEGREAIEPFIQEATLIVVDNPNSTRNNELIGVF